MESNDVRHSDGKPYVSSPRYVDPNFLEMLHRLDQYLEPRWNPARCLWEIWRQNKYVLTVQSKDGSYRPLDNRTLIRLFNADTGKYANKYQYIQSLHTEDKRLMDKKRKEQDDYIRSCHEDMMPFTRGATSVHLDPNKEMK